MVKSKVVIVIIRVISGFIMCFVCLRLLCFYVSMDLSGNVIVRLIINGVNVVLKNGGLIDSIWFMVIFVISG